MNKAKAKRKKEVGGQHDLLLQAWECAFSSQRILYLSGPITTGRRFLDWYLRIGRKLKQNSARYVSQHRKQVIGPNELDIRKAAQWLRKTEPFPVVEPASLRILSWTQEDYHSLWRQLIERFAQRLVLMPGWQYSAGCAAEFEHSLMLGIPIVTLSGDEISAKEGTQLLSDAASEFESTKVPINDIGIILKKLSRRAPRRVEVRQNQEAHFRKDESLDRLAETINVAQFVSFSPGRKPTQEYARVRGYSPNHRFRSVRESIDSLLRLSADSSINIRSFKPESPQSHEFIYGVRSTEDAIAAINRLTLQESLNVIVNETVDVKDGGVSGVIQGSVIEFSPDDTPRCVEKPGVTSLPRGWGLSVISTVYNFVPDIDVAGDSRLEFSVHPKRRGWKNTQTLGWELQKVGVSLLKPKLIWPTNFSRMLGDKVFGLLMAHQVGLQVPRTTIVNRRIAPFSFGSSTGVTEYWLRTSPREQVPGRFTTSHGWIDPFVLLLQEDPGGDQIPSVIAQQGVEPAYSGAAIVGVDGELIIEGRAGEGETLMRGGSPPEKLPDQVIGDVKEVFLQAKQMLGPVRFEWVHDGSRAWTVQLHVGATQTSQSVLVPGEATNWRRFDPGRGLNALRLELSMMGPDDGVILTGHVGLTSHIADVLRKSRRPTRIQPHEISVDSTDRVPLHIVR